MTENEAIEWIESLRDSEDLQEFYYQDIFIESLDMAIQALEKQIPKKVKIEQWIYTKCDCGYEFSRHHGDGYYSIPLEKKTNYCPNCGQKLDWSE